MCKYPAYAWNTIETYDPAYISIRMAMSLCLYQTHSVSLYIYREREIYIIYLHTHTHTHTWGFPGGVSGKEPAYQCRRLKRCRFKKKKKKEMQVWSLDREDPLEKGMATHSGVLAWRIPWTEEPGGLQSMGSQRVRHDWRDLVCTHACIYIHIYIIIIYETCMS